MSASVVARADDHGRSQAGSQPVTTAPVIGGSNAPAGKWPDVAAIYDGKTGIDRQVCSGTLIAPTVALTAGHCNEDGIVIDNILVGAISLAHPEVGEMLPVVQRIEYPLSQSSEDVTVLVLGRASKFAPRAIATGWAHFDIANGAAVALVGYGAINKDGDHYIDDLQEATSTITDFDCSDKPGCHPDAMPDGELGAGGMGIDTCPGDSGGPMYLVTDYGEFLAGVTSRGYAGAQFSCSEGGIYERPDKIVDWIEQQAGPVARGPEPTFDPVGPLTIATGDGGETVIAANDPKTGSHTFEITTAPAHGQAKVRDDGRVRVCIDPTAPATTDGVTVTVTDAGNANRALDVVVPIAIVLAAPPTTPCDVGAFSVGEDGGGCCDSGRGAAGSSIPLAIVLGALGLRRPSQRRRAS